MKGGPGRPEGVGSSSRALSLTSPVLHTTLHILGFPTAGPAQPTRTPFSGILSGTVETRQRLASRPAGCWQPWMVMNLIDHYLQLLWYRQHSGQSRLWIPWRHPPLPSWEGRGLTGVHLPQATSPHPRPPAPPGLGIPITTFTRQSPPV